MEDNKTKLKMKTLDTLLIISLQVNHNESKRIISGQMNKIYFDMYLEKLQLSLK